MRGRVGFDGIRVVFWGFCFGRFGFREVRRVLRGNYVFVFRYSRLFFGFDFIVVFVRVCVYLVFIVEEVL